MAKASPQPNPEMDPFVFIGDGFWGQGGSYLLDPATGKRTRLEESAATEPAQQPGPAPSTPSPVTTNGTF
jgi:hypothetical protein